MSTVTSGLGDRHPHAVADLGAVDRLAELAHLGAGLAGLAGCALTQIGNVGPSLGQNYIVDSFMVVVTGGVGIVWLICWQIWFAKPEETAWLGDAEMPAPIRPIVIIARANLIFIIPP